MKIYSGFSQAVGRTPLVELKNIEKLYGLKAHIVAKLESVNPAGSIKDRVAVHMIEDAEEKGIIMPGGTIIEPTSGNTGIGLAAAAASKGYKAIFVMPDTMSRERIALLKAYGAEVVLTKGEDGMKGSIEKAEEIAKAMPNSFIPAQFDNPANAETHYLTTAREIFEDSDGNIDIFIASVGTGGTLTGNARFLKEKKPDIKVIAVEPASSPLLSKGYSGSHKIQGIGANFVPKVLDTSLIDEIIAVSDEDALKLGGLVARKEGFLVGISSGAVLFAAIETAKKPENEGKTIVVIFPDNGDRYLSSEMFEKE